MLEQGGAAALRLLCMREMPVHQVFCNKLQNALCTTCIRSENTTGNVACALLAVLRCCSWLVLCWPLLLLSLLRHLCMRSQVLLNNGLYTTNIKANREMTFRILFFACGSGPSTLHCRAAAAAHKQRQNFSKASSLVYLLHVKVVWRAFLRIWHRFGIAVQQPPLPLNTQRCPASHAKASRAAATAESIGQKRTIIS